MQILLFRPLSSMEDNANGLNINLKTFLSPFFVINCIQTENNLPLNAFGQQNAVFGAVF